MTNYLKVFFQKICNFSAVSDIRFLNTKMNSGVLELFLSKDIMNIQNVILKRF